MAADAELLRAVIRHYGGEVRDGYSKPVKCCFHQDAHRSAVMSTYGDKAGLYYCHTCGIGGDAYTLLMWREGVEFRVAIERAIDIAKGSGIDIQSKDRRKDSLLSSRTRVQQGVGKRPSSRNRASRL